MGALPLGILAKEVTTAGRGQVKALVESGGNLALTAPGSVEMQAALKDLELLVSIDFYQNETATMAAETALVPTVYILPATTPLERENIHVTHLNYNVVPHVEYHGPVVEPPRSGPRPEWEIFMALTRRMGLVPFGNKMFGILAKFLRAVHKDLSPGFIVGLLSILGNLMEHHPPRISSQAITFGSIRKRGLIVWKQHRHGVLREFLLTRNKKVHLAAPEIVGMLQRFMNAIQMNTASLQAAPDDEGFLLIGRRHPKTMNSWLHNIPRLHADIAGPRLLVNAADGARLGLESGQLARVFNDNGEITVPVELTGDIMPGVACYPHGWGHHPNGLHVARSNPGQNYNVLVASSGLEPLSGMPRFNAIRVRVEKKG
ncbi:MAG: hypothetical protein GYA24_24985, partial [Candidatus Lokiarchaeota archaeon]|nr:hypothetical protein [Candidatus Lokiarchaeota archaeon]